MTGFAAVLVVLAGCSSTDATATTTTTTTTIPATTTTVAELAREARLAVARCDELLGDLALAVSLHGPDGFDDTFAACEEAKLQVEVDGPEFAALAEALGELRANLGAVSVLLSLEEVTPAEAGESIEASIALYRAATS